MKYRKYLLVFMYLLSQAPLGRSQWSGGSLGSFTPTPGQRPIVSTSLTSIGQNLICGTDSGIYVSSDEGLTWLASNTGLTTTDITSLCIFNRFAFAGSSDGLFRSDDSGRTWLHLKDAFTWPYFSHITAIVSHDSEMFVGDDRFGVYRSNDSGLSWTSIRKGLVDTEVLSLATSTGVLYAGTTNGMFRSLDDGNNWTRIDQGFNTPRVVQLAGLGQNVFAGCAVLTATLAYASGILFSSSDSGEHWIGREYVGTNTEGKTSSIVIADSLVFAFLFNDSRNIIVMSRDSGQTWKWIDDGPNARSAPTDVEALAVHHGFLYAAGTARVSRRSLNSILNPQSDVTNRQTVLQNVIVYPNPAQSMVYFEVAEGQQSDITIMNSLGQQVYHSQTDRKLTWNSSAVPSGTYECIVASGQSVQTQKLLIVH